MFDSQICILFYFFARQKPESAFMFRWYLVWHLLTWMKHRNVWFPYISEVTSGHYYKLGSQAPDKESDWHKAAQAGRRKKQVTCQGSFPMLLWKNITFNKTIPSSYQKSVFLLYFKVELHRQLDFSRGLHLILMHHRRSGKGEYCWYKRYSSSHVYLHDPTSFALAILWENDKKLVD